MSKYKILITDRFDRNLINNNIKKLNIKYQPKITLDELLEIIQKFHIIIISTRITINRELLKKASNLVLIVRMGVGVDHIDLNECRVRGVMVCNTPNANVNAVTEFVFGQLLRRNRNFSRMEKNIYAGNFRTNIIPGNQLFEKKIGIIGVGRIGSSVSKVAKVFGMKVIGYDPYISDNKRKKTAVDKWVSNVGDLLKVSDIITLHVPLTNETEYMVNHNFMNKMNKGTILVNTSRGKVVRLDDIIDFAKKERIHKFILDVYENEPYKPNIDKVIKKFFYFSPHAAAYTKESLLHRSIEAFEEVVEFMKGGKPHGIINLERGY